MQQLLLMLCLQKLDINSSHPGQNGCHFAEDSFKRIFMNANFFISIWISVKYVPQGSKWQWVSIGSGNGLALNRQQAIIWTNADPVHRHICAALGREVFIALQMATWDLTHLISLIVSEGSGDVMVLRRSRPPPATRHPPPAMVLTR